MKMAWGRAWGRRRLGALLGHEPALGRRFAGLHRHTATWSTYIHSVGSGTFGDYVFKITFIWISIGVAIASLRYGKWIPNLGAIIRIGVLLFFSITVVIYAIEHGVNTATPPGSSTRSS